MKNDEECWLCSIFLQHLAFNADYEGTKRFIGIIMTPSNSPEKIDTNLKKKYLILDNFCSFYAILKILSHLDFGPKSTF